MKPPVIVSFCLILSVLQLHVSGNSRSNDCLQALLPPLKCYIVTLERTRPAYSNKSYHFNSLRKQPVSECFNAVGASNLSLTSNSHCITISSTMLPQLEKITIGVTWGS
uniref:U3 protein n=1 Tax=XiangYang Rhabdovirus 6 TaxID=3230308 RepID=A0AAU8BEG3_9RHAB